MRRLRDLAVQLAGHLAASTRAFLRQTQVQQVLVLLGAALLALGMAYCSGWRARGAHDRGQAYQQARKALVDTITIVKRELVHDSILVRDTRAASDTARHRFATASARLTVVGDSLLAIDSGPPVPTVPAVRVIPALVSARAAIALDSIAYRALAQHDAHETDRADHEARRADLAEEELKDGPHGPSRLKWAVIGAGAVGLAKLVISLF